MAYPKRLRKENLSNQERAIKAHSGFVSYVVGKVNKVGIGKVLQQYRPALGAPTEFYWLLKSYERVLDFAERLQLAKEAKPLVDQSTHTHFTVVLDGEKNNGPVDSEAIRGVSTPVEL